MADEVAGRPFEDGEEPEDRDHGAADDAFGSVVFDEAFVRAATVHEPTAAERMLAAAQSRAETEPPPTDEGYGATGRGTGRLRWRRADPEPDAYDGADHDDHWYDDDLDHGYGAHPHFRDEHDYREYAAYKEFRESEDTPGYRGGRARWLRPVAWVLAVVMGVGVVAMAFAAVYRSGSGQRDEPAPPPATSELDTGLGGQRPPAASASPAAYGEPHTPLPTRG